MAAAEARAAWQRTANRYFVQEDAKRAPKLACCQSSTSSSKQTEVGPATAVDGSDHPALGFMPSNRNPSYSNLPPDAKWWLQMQPNYVHHHHQNQKGLNFDPFNGRTVEETAMLSEESICSVEYEDVESFLDVKKDHESKLEELDIVDDGKVDQDFVDLKNMTDYYEFLEMEMVGGSVSERTSKLSSIADSSWMGGEKVPWWRVTDGDELASFVAQKSLHHIENCDLPPPQKKNVRCVHHDEIIVSSVDGEVHSDAISTPSCGGFQRKHWSSISSEGLSQDENAGVEPLSSPRLKMPRAKDDPPEEGRVTMGDTSKAQLLEALCHSQTRAREAEKAAKQAYTEKQHLLKLFFRQASQLFAYKQWYKLLQLETLLLQTKCDDSSPSTTFPDLLPWMQQKPRKLHKSLQKSSSRGKRRKRGSQGNEIGKYAVAFAVGFTLVGAGLILGWTVGWLLPAF